MTDNNPMQIEVTFQITEPVDIKIDNLYDGGDGNEIEYPIENPSQNNKSYKESDINAIAVALGENNLKVSDMAGVIAGRCKGMVATFIDLKVADCTIEQ